MPPLPVVLPACLGSLLLRTYDGSVRVSRDTGPEATSVQMVLMSDRGVWQGSCGAFEQLIYNQPGCAKIASGRQQSASCSIAEAQLGTVPGKLASQGVPATRGSRGQVAGTCAFQRTAVRCSTALGHPGSQRTALLALGRLRSCTTVAGCTLSKSRVFDLALMCMCEHKRPIKSISMYTQASSARASNRVRTAATGFACGR